MLPETFYHIYTHANGSENLFRTDENFHFFLRRYAHFIHPVADTFAYCLMPNHVNFLVRIKTETELEEAFGKFETFQKLEARLSKQFANLFSSYTQAYNKVYNRRGSLFIPNFKRKPVESEQYFTALIQYIHANPVHHGFVHHISDWNWSSYHALLSEKNTRLKREEVLGWFGGKEGFRNSHHHPSTFQPILDMDY